MSDFMRAFWQANLELSLLLLAILLARFLVRKTTRVYNAYLLWMSAPLGLLAANLVTKLQLSQPPVESINVLVHNYVIEPASKFDGWFLAGLIWLAISLFLLARLIRQHWQLRRDLRAIQVASPPQPPASQYPLIHIDKNDFSPAVYGFVRPRIYFPIHLYAELSAAQVRLILRHEEEHIRQQHLWLNLLWDIAVCLMWFNPLVYLSRQRFRHDQELFCDYLVLQQTSAPDQQSYGHALLSTVSATHSVSLLCSWKSFHQLEERIMNIKKSSSPASRALMLTGSIAIIFCASMYTVSAASYSQPQSIHHEISDDGDDKMVLKTDGKHYVEHNGERYMVEDGERRAMTPEEEQAFTEARARADKHLSDAQRQLSDHEIELRMHEKELREEDRVMREEERAVRRKEHEQHSKERREHRIIILETEHEMRDEERKHRHKEQRHEKELETEIEREVEFIEEDDVSMTPLTFPNARAALQSPQPALPPAPVKQFQAIKIFEAATELQTLREFESLAPLQAFEELQSLEALQTLSPLEALAALQALESLEAVNPPAAPDLSKAH